MPITSSLRPADIRAMINERIERKKQTLFVRLFYIAEECLNNARESHKYKVQTGNLTSSINYCIIDNGEIVKAGEWKATPGTENGKQGMEKGMEYLRQMADAQPQDGITFLMVAGMPYAKYVEAMSLDVLETSEDMAARKIKAMIHKLLTTGSK
jgi:hypothetical protein|nr:MAG TPA: hypothetical protein [Caudoviricetes sp.]